MFLNLCHDSEHVHLVISDVGLAGLSGLNKIMLYPNGQLFLEAHCVKYIEWANKNFDVIHVGTLSNVYQNTWIN